MGYRDRGSDLIMSLRDEILAGGFDLAGRDCQAIADELSTTKAPGYVSREAFATWAAKTGMRAKIEDHALTAGHPLRSISLALIDVLRSPTVGIDFAVQDNRDMLDVWVDFGELSAADAGDLLELSSKEVKVTAQQVADAIYNPDGSLK
jgi:hypothetical protein